MKRRRGSVPWARYVALVLLVSLLLRAPRAYTAESVSAADARPPIWPVTVERLVDELRGTTRQASRIAAAVDREEIQVEVLNISPFSKQYRMLGGEGNPTAFARGSRVYLYVRSPAILSELVHEGTHALDSLSGRDIPRLRLELRAYYQEWRFQRAVGARPDFGTLIGMVWYVHDRYG